MKTVETLLDEIRQHRNCSKVHFYRLIGRLGITPLTKTRPALYPADTAQRVLAHLGLLDPQTPRLVSGKALRKARRVR